ncbi:hypothetical protein NB713_000820 [Xanthomonas sacchari]|nr:hypothetical protein [Xanthomonas sacchari]
MTHEPMSSNTSKCSTTRRGVIPQPTGYHPNSSNNAISNGSKVSRKTGAIHKACSIRIEKLLTDNGKEFTHCLFASKEREPSGQHEFD